MSFKRSQSCLIHIAVERGQFVRATVPASVRDLARYARLLAGIKAGIGVAVEQVGAEGDRAILLPWRLPALVSALHPAGRSSLSD
jgi:hypothetical protein